MTPLFAFLILAQEPQVLDQGLFTTYVSGKPIATEGFKILDNGRSSSIISSIQGDQVTVTVKTAFMTEAGVLKAATINVVGKEVVHMTLKGADFVYGDGTKVPTGGEPVYSAENFAWHNMTHVFRAYKPEGGKQNFKVIVPSLKTAVDLELEKAGERDVEGKKLWDWNGSASGLTQSFVTDTNGCLLFMKIPTQNVEVVRNGYESLSSIVAGGTNPPVATNLQPNKDKYDERDVQVFAGAAVTLGGTLTVPKGGGKYPAVLLISGSGPQDRDWNAAPKITNSPAMQIADRLGAAGYVVLRYDDRGVGKSTGEKVGATLGNLTSDARALANFLKARPEVDPFRVVVCGHSEGGVIAPMVASTDPTIAGCIVIAAPSRPLDQIIQEQLTAQAADERLPAADRDLATKLLPEMNDIIAKAKAGDRGNVQGISLAWLREHMNHDPKTTIAQLRKPLLIVQGLDDLMVLSRNAADLEKAAKDAGVDTTVQLIPRMTHILTQFPIDNPDFDANNPSAMVPSVFDSMVNWLNAKVAKK